MNKPIIFLFFFLHSLHALADSNLRLHIFHSPTGIDWSSPKKLIISVLKNQISFKDRKIGHVAVELNCDNSNREEGFQLLTGMTYEDKSVYRNQILWQQLGFGVMFGSVPGKLEKRKELEQEIFIKSKIENSPRYNFINFLISNKSCRKLENYFKEYKSKKYFLKYGLPNNPLKKQGAGCSAFAVSFLKVSGIMQPEFEAAWSLNRKVDYSLIGGPENLPSPKNKVGLFSLLTLEKSRDRWRSDWESGRNVLFYDPDRMFDWVKKHISENLKNLPLKGTLLKYNNSFGLQFDFRNIPSPEGDPFSF